MKNYVVAYIDFMNNDLKMEEVVAFSTKEALIEAVKLLGFDPSEESFETEEDIKRFAFDCDGMVEAYPLN